MLTKALLAAGAAVLGVLAPVGSPAAAGTVQTAACNQDQELRLHGDGAVYACRVSRGVTLSVGPEAGNREVACASDSYVEFHRNGRLSYCDRTAKAAAYVTPNGETKLCKGRGPISFDQLGYLEYCS